MPRIRTIKPEFWRSPDTASASPVARLLYIAMWNWADDAGRGEADLKALEGFAFPNDDIRELSGGTSDNLRQVLAEVVECYGVTVYIAGGRPYYEIPSWREHQRNERTAKGKYPGPEKGVTCTVDELGGKGRKFRRTDAEAPKSSGPGTGEQGNRGTGEEKTCSTPAESNPEFAAFWETYPRRQGKGEARKAFTKARRSTSAEVILASAKRYRDDPNRSEQFTALPATWLNQGRWDDDPLPPRLPSSAPVSRRENTLDAWSTPAGLQVGQSAVFVDGEVVPPRREIA